MEEQEKKQDDVKTDEQTEAKNDQTSKPEKKDVQPEAKYTDEDVDRIIDEKFARWQEKQEEKIAEAEKIAQMNADEKQEYEREQLKKELEEYKRRDQFNQMSREVSKMLADEQIPASEEILKLVVRSDAEETKQAVDAFVELVGEVTDVKVKQRLGGRTPKKYSNQSGNVTAKAFDKMSYGERLELKQSDQKAYNRLNKGER